MTQELFEKVVIEIFKKFMLTFFRYELKVCNLKDISEDDKHFDEVIFISLFGNIEGGFVLEVNNETIQKFLNQIHQTMKEEIDFHQLVKGYIGELGNLLATRIVTNLNKNFGDTFLSTPSLFTGMGMKVDLFYDTTYKADIDCEFGLFRISFSVKE